MADRKIIIDVEVNNKDSKRTIKQIEDEIRALLVVYKDLDIRDKQRETVLSNIVALNKELADASQQLNQELGKENKSLGGVNEGAKFAEQSLGALRQEQKKLRGEIQRYPLTDERTIEYAEQLQDVNTKVKAFQDVLKPASKASKDFNLAQENAIKIIEKEDATLKELTEAYKDLSTAQKNVATNSKEFETSTENLTKLKDRIKPQKTSFFESIFGNIDLSVITGVGAITAAAGIAATAIKEMFNELKEFENLRKTVAGVTGLTGQTLTDFTAQVSAISTTYDKSTEDILQSAQNFSKEFGISYKEALTLLEQGLLRGGDANGEFIQSSKEYTAQLKKIGLSAEETIAVISDLNSQGFYDDKAIDAVKEAGLAIAEQTQATKDALVNAFGQPFSDDILSRVKNGSTSLIDAIREISKRSVEAGLDAQQSAQLFADVFKGAGEDAGPRLLEVLANLKTSLNDLPLDEYGLQTYRLSLLNKALQEEIGNVADALREDSQEFEIFKKEVLLELLKLFTSLLPTLRVVAAFLKGSFKQSIQNVKDVFESVINTVKSFKDIFDAIRNLDFSKLVKSVTSAFTNIKDIFANFGKGLFTSFVAGGKSAAQQITKEMKRGVYSMEELRNAQGDFEKKQSALSKKNAEETSAHIQQLSKDAQKKIADDFKALQKEIEDLRKKSLESYRRLTLDSVELLTVQKDEEIKLLKEQKAFRALSEKDQKALLLEIEKKYTEDLLKIEMDSNQKLLDEQNKHYDNSVKSLQNTTDEQINIVSESLNEELRKIDANEFNKRLEYQRTVKENKKWRKLNVNQAAELDKIEAERQKEVEDNKQLLIIKSEREIIAIKTESLRKQIEFIKQQSQILSDFQVKQYQNTLQSIEKARESALALATTPEEIDKINERYDKELEKAQTTFEQIQTASNENTTTQINNLSKQQDENNKAVDAINEKEKQLLAEREKRRTKKEKADDSTISKLKDMIEHLDRINEKYKEGTNIIQSATDTITNLIIDSANKQIEASNKVIEASKNRISEIETLEKDASGKRRALLKKESQDEKKRLEENTKNVEDAQKKVLAAEKKAALIRKAIAIGQISIDTAKAIAAALVLDEQINAGIPLHTIFAAATGATQLAAVLAQKFKRGGLIRGKKHSEGGIPAVANNSLIEIEDNEIILTAGVARNPLKRAIASALNQSEGGVKFQSGGIPSQIQIPNLFNNNINEQMLNELKLIRKDYQTISPIVTVEDINKVQTKHNQVIVKNQL